MNILAVDTALGACSVAVLAGDKVLAHRLELMERGHAEALAPMVERAMSEAGIAFAALDRLGVTTGPGTFTGQRVGLAFMRGLRLALERPLIGLTSLEVMAYEALEETGLELAAAVHDARDDALYFQLCGRTAPFSLPCLIKLSDAATSIAELGETVALAGAASSRLLENRSIDAKRVVQSTVLVPDALWVARLARSRPPPTEVPKPLYLHKPAAKLPGPVK
jgi:tRNA threonylcarbamoyladenosine biosynthesis protein TsaB